MISRRKRSVCVDRVGTTKVVNSFQQMRIHSKSNVRDRSATNALDKSAFTLQNPHSWIHLIFSEFPLFVVRRVLTEMSKLYYLFCENCSVCVCVCVCTAADTFESRRATVDGTKLPLFQITSVCIMTSFLFQTTHR